MATLTSKFRADRAPVKHWAEVWALALAEPIVAVWTADANPRHPRPGWQGRPLRRELAPIVFAPNHERAYICS